MNPLIADNIEKTKALCTKHHVKSILVTKPY